MTPTGRGRPACLLEGLLLAQSLRDPKFLYPHYSRSLPNSWLAVPVSLFSPAGWAPDPVLAGFMLHTLYLPIHSLSLHPLLPTTAPQRLAHLKLYPSSTPRLDPLGS